MASALGDVLGARAKIVVLLCTIPPTSRTGRVQNPCWPQVTQSLVVALVIIHLGSKFSHLYVSVIQKTLSEVPTKLSAQGGWSISDDEHVPWTY